MNAIEERAKEYGNYQLAETGIDNEIWEQAYTQGAKEQQRIDIERAINILSNVMNVSYVWNEGNKYCIIDIGDFKKEMDESL